MEFEIKSDDLKPQAAGSVSHKKKLMTKLIKLHCYGITELDKILPL